jgi:VIT1/CCC1 family predicted Fe2+/Mn2+ transporter
MGASNYLSLRSHGRGPDLPTRRAAALHGLATFFSFVVAGGIPLAAYLLSGAAPHRFPVAVVVTLGTLFVVGAARSIVTRRSWWPSGLEMLLVGASAAGVAYGVGAILASLIGCATTGAL